MTLTDAQTTTVPDGVEFAHVDPRTLLIETNVRTRPDLDADFLDSIRTYGVHTPVHATRDPDGNLLVRAGQRRTLGAIETDQATVPVYITQATPDETDRIFKQLDENHSRRAVSDTDTTSAFQQLTLLGVSAAQIAKRSHNKRTTVDAALTVAASTVASAVLAEHDLTLDQALVFAEFGDDQAIVDELTETAVKDPQKFAHTAQRLRDDRAAQDARDALTAELAAVGIVVVARPDYDDKTTNLNSLRDAEGTYLDAQAHATCPGRAAYIPQTYGQHAPRAVHVCLDPKAHGHVNTSTTSGSGTATGPMSEEQKADRRAVIAGNKAWTSAEKVRRAWLRTFAARKTTPKDAPALIAYAVTTCNTDLTHAAQSGHALARTALGLDAAKSNGYGGFVAGEAAITNAIDAASLSRAQLIGLVVVLAAIEARTGTHTWRNPTPTIARYLRAIASWGYNLSEIEQSTLDRHEGRNTTAPDLDQDSSTDDDDVQDDYDEDDMYTGTEHAGAEAQAATDAQE